jgi:transposase
MIRMLIVCYCMGIRSERRIREEVHLNLAYRWFCRLDLTDAVPDHSTFSKNRHDRFRDSDLFRKLFEDILARCIAEVTHQNYMHWGCLLDLRQVQIHTHSTERFAGLS